jgi:hypothetical protein
VTGGGRLTYLQQRTIRKWSARSPKFVFVNHPSTQILLVLALPHARAEPMHD